MSSVVTRSPLFRLASQTRGLAAAATQAAASACSAEPKSTTLSNGTIVVASENPLKVAKVAVTIRAGSRYESPENAGVSHVLRASCGLTTQSSGQFLLTRKIQSLGSSLSAVGDRETITYVLESLQENLDESLALLKAVVTEQTFKPWELSDNVPRIKYELAAIPSQAVAFDLAHKAAYRRCLGNSLFVKEFNINKINSETLKHFVSSRFVTSKTSVIGLGVDMECMTQFAECLGLTSGESKSASSPSVYKGGDAREERGSNKVDIVIAGEASGLNKKDVFTWAVLRQALGAGSSVKWGSGVDPISKSVCNTPGAIIRAFNVAYSDSGLFGVAITCDGNDAKEIVSSAMKVAAEGVTEIDVARGKAQLKSQILGSNSDGLLFDLAGQAALVRSVRSPANLAAEIDAVTAQAVTQALSSFVKSPKSLGAVGDTNRVPYLDEL